MGLEVFLNRVIERFGEIDGWSKYDKFPVSVIRFVPAGKGM